VAAGVIAAAAGSGGDIISVSQPVMRPSSQIPVTVRATLPSTANVFMLEFSPMDMRQLYHTCIRGSVPGNGRRFWWGVLGGGLLVVPIAAAAVLLSITDAQQEDWFVPSLAITVTLIMAIALRLGGYSLRAIAAYQTANAALPAWTHTWPDLGRGMALVGCWFLCTWPLLLLIVLAPAWTAPFTQLVYAAVRLWLMPAMALAFVARGRMGDMLSPARWLGFWQGQVWHWLRRMVWLEIRLTGWLLVALLLSGITLGAGSILVMPLMGWAGTLLYADAVAGLNRRQMPRA